MWYKNRHTREQMTHWDMLNKEIQIWWLSFCPSASFALQYGDFVPRDCSAAKGPLQPFSNSCQVLNRSEMSRTSMVCNLSVCLTTVDPLWIVKYKGILLDDPAQSYTFCR